MKKTSITQKDYYNITNCSGDFGIPRFDFDQVCKFLENRGYEIIIHKATAKITETSSEFGSGEVRRTGNYWDTVVEGILAVKPNQVLPDRLDSPEGTAMGFSNVFYKEIQKQILGF